MAGVNLFVFRLREPSGARWKNDEKQRKKPQIVDGENNLYVGRPK